MIVRIHLIMYLRIICLDAAPVLVIHVSRQSLFWMEFAAQTTTQVKRYATVGMIAFKSRLS